MEDYKIIQNQKQIIEELKEQIEELQEEILQQILNKVDEKKKYKKIIKQQDTWLSEQHKQIEHMNNSSKQITKILDDNSIDQLNKLKKIKNLNLEIFIQTFK